MRSISKEILIDLLELILEKATLVMSRNQSISVHRIFLYRQTEWRNSMRHAC